MAAGGEQGISLDAHGIDHVTIPGFDDFVAGKDNTVPVAPILQLVDPRQTLLFFQQALQAQLQHLGGKRLEQIVVRQAFGGSHHVLVALFGRDHDEQHAAPDDAPGAQEFEELLAIGAFAEVVVRARMTSKLCLRNCSSASLTLPLTAIRSKPSIPTWERSELRASGMSSRIRRLLLL
jgi:hypothetical protein